MYEIIECRKTQILSIKENKVFEKEKQNDFMHKVGICRKYIINIII